MLDSTVPPCSIWQRVIDKEYSVIGIESELTRYLTLTSTTARCVLYRRPS
jgi:hypothetical protein